MEFGRRVGTIGQIRTLFAAGTAAGLSDAQLLERFASRDGEASELAFSALVERHGPMVFRACRAIARDDHLAQDASQASFLLLARKAGTLWVGDSIGPWLHRVACRVATRAEVAEGKRRAAERRAAEASPGFVDGPAADDRARVVHEEIDRLPDRYRRPVVICDLGGRSYEEAASELGCPVGTVKSRLARGRDRLRDRLTRRGLAPSAWTVGLGPVGGLIPPGMAGDVARPGVRLATGGPASTSVASLVRWRVRGDGDEDNRPGRRGRGRPGDDRHRLGVPPRDEPGPRGRSPRRRGTTRRSPTLEGRSIAWKGPGSGSRPTASRPTGSSR